MAYVDPQQNQDEEQDPNQPGGMGGAQGTEGPSTSMGDISSGSSGAAPTASGQGVAAHPTTAKPQQYQNLGAYLTANAPQTEAMGQQIAGGLTNQFNQVQGGIDQATQGFNQAVQQGKTSLDQSLIDAAAANPAQFVQGAGNVDAFQKQLNAQYTGPTDFTQNNAYTGLNAQVQNAVQTAQNAASPSGLQTIVAPYERNPTRGIQGLDALLLQQNPGAQSAIKSAAQPLASLGDYFGAQTAGANDAAKQAQEITAAVRPAVQAAINPVASNFQQGLTAAQQSAEAQRQQFNTQLQTIQQKMAANQPLTAQEASLIGVDPAQYAALLEGRSKLNTWSPLGPVGNYYQASPIEQAPTLGTVATTDQYATDAALEQLLGEGYNNILNPEQAAQAGSYNPNAQIPQTSAQQLAWNLLNAFQQGSGNLNITGRQQQFANDWDALASLIGPQYTAGTYDQVRDLPLFNNPLAPLQ